MRNPLHKIVGGLFGIALAAVMALVAYAQPVRPFSPRYFTSQQTHYLRFVVNFNSCVLVSNTCSYRVGAIPYNSFVVRGYQQVTTAFNSGTTDTLAVGLTSGGAGLVAAQTVHAGTAGLPLTIVAANLGIALSGNGITPTGADGGFDVFVTYAQTGAAPTAGVAVVILEFFGPNDGTCIVPALGATAPAC